MAFAPDVFHIGDDDQLTVLVEQLGDDLLGQVRAAVSGCPTGALSVQDGCNV
jgi:ferredoxin